ncbi:MFS transporter [Nocardioides mangrovicus]|uniref:MFS transporter n=1 Tax=Nocardioides mangrovicus TaxID=2478913 RepID=A0A3L8P064_9ACTN|nr:MFS transporter [Nocardioides mangrovicus]RLV48401.1 MFS transporter [Nocardioides mangrovicus]
MLAVSTYAQAASAVTMHGPAFLIPVLHRRLGFTLAEAGLVAAAPTVGVMATLVLWGIVVDRRGERFALLAGLVGTTLADLVAVVLQHHVVALALALGVAGAFAASTNSASGRVVVGWFPPQRRGLTMGIRQMAQPVGVGIAAIGIAVLADRHGVGAALVLPTVLAAAAVVAVLLVVLDPPRPDRHVAQAPNPYRDDRFLVRIHAVSVLLVVPQFVVWTYALVWLVQDRGWSAAAAGTTVALAQIVGAFSRIGVGQLSDVVGGRVRPLRWVTIAAVVSMLLLGATAALGWWVAVVVMVVATGVTVADNGLSFTAVAERAGPFWSGRALGLQNTAQFLGAAAVPPLAGLLVSGAGFGWTFALAALFPLLALPLVPVRDEGPLA